jgi:hypothetical protein
MVAYAPARRVATALVAIAAAAAVGTPGAHAAHHDHPGVKRLWSQFPLGPHLRTGAATQAPSRQAPRPSTPAHTRASAHAAPPHGRHTSWWPWAIVAGGAGVLVAAIAGLKRRGRSRQATAPDIGGAVPPPSRADTDPVHPAPSTQPERDPGPSVQPRTSPGTLGTGSAYPRVSERALLRYAAAYAEACREGDPDPIQAVTELVSPTTDDPVGYSRRMVAEARRRDLLTGPGRGGAGDELTAQARKLLGDIASEGRPPSRR